MGVVQRAFGGLWDDREAETLRLRLKKANGPAENDSAGPFAALNISLIVLLDLGLEERIGAGIRDSDGGLFTLRESGVGNFRVGARRELT